MFSSALFRKSFLSILIVVVSFAVAIYSFSVPHIKKTIHSIEEESAKTILDNVYRLVESQYASVESYRQSALDAYKKQLKNITLIGEAFLRTKYEQSRQGVLSEETAKREALEQLRSFRYGKDDYLWVSDYRSVLISHPDPKLYNADFSKVTDIYGNLIVPRLVQVAREKGEGFTSYFWRRLGKQEPIEKLTYSRDFSPWQWVIGTGVYIDDVATEVAKRREKIVEDLRRTLRGIKVARTGYMYIFDSKMNMIIHPNSNIENTNFSGLLDPATNKPIGPELMAVARNGTGKLNYKWDRPDDKGRYVYDKTSWVRYFKGFDWYIATSVYADELNRSAILLGNRILVFSAILLLLSIGTASVFLRKITAPVKALSDMALKVRDGDLTARCDVEGRDEIGVLASAFNSMVGRLRANIATLDNKVRERTRELDEKNARLKAEVAERKRAEQALQEAKDAAEAASRAKSDFLANMSHEIRTPLNAIIGMVELAMDGDLSDHDRNTMHVINAEADSLLRIVNDILDFSKIEAGRLELEETDIDVGSLVEDVAAGVAWQAEKKGVEVVSFVGQDIAERLMGDPGRLRQVLMNLAGNAVKFTPRGEVYIRAELAEDLGDRVRVRFAVKDTGIGISQDKQAMIFESFTQADGSTTRKYGGTGLGTTISKHLVELMGGVLEVESKEGQGSTFYFSVVLGKGSKRPKKCDADIDLKDLKVLIVDDNANNRYILGEYFKRWGCAPTEAKDGREAFMRLKEAWSENSPYALVLTDYQMPETNGLDLAVRIREDRQLAETPVVLLSSMSLRSAEECERIGIQGYLTKPVRRDELRGAVQAVLGAVPRANRTSRTMPVTHNCPAAASGREIRILVAEDYPTNQQVVVRHLESAG
ncbi:MAG: cache domain-containing protein, partial [Deltaproteobacteria bacterium]|nr:cache domain-containing protein [Deltaproteobacteria bacterium]